MNNEELSDSLIKFYLNNLDKVKEIAKEVVQNFFDLEINNLFYGPGDEYRIAVLGAFDTWPFMDFICRILTNQGYICITSRYIYHKFKEKIIRFPTTLIKQYTSEAYQMSRLLKKIIQNCLLAIINYSVSAAHYIETDWCSKQDNLNLIGIAFVRNPYKSKNCDYLRINSIPESSTFYSICDVINHCSDWKAWDCIDVENFCPFKQQDISKNILEYYFSGKKKSKLISVENLENLPYIFDVIFKNIENTSQLDEKYQTKFEESISKFNIEAESIEFLFLNKGLEVLLFLKLCWMLLKKILKQKKINSDLLGLFQKIKNLDEFIFPSAQKEIIINNLNNTTEDKTILNEIFLNDNKMLYFSLNGIISIRDIIFKNYGSNIIDFLNEKDFIESKNCLWFLTSKSYTLLNNLNIDGVEVVKNLINNYNEEKIRFNHRYLREGLGYALEQPEFLTYNHIESCDQINLNFLKQIGLEDREKIQNLLDKNDYKKVMKTIDIIYEKNPENIELFLFKGRIFFIQKKYQQAINAFNKVLFTENNNDLSLLYKGISLSELDQHQESIECYNKILETKPNDYHVLFHKGVSLLILKNYKNALECFDNVIKNDPINTSALGNKGITLSKLKRYEEAIEYFNKILEIEPNDKSSLGNKGITLNKLERYEKAIEYFNKILEIEPNNKLALVNKGISLSKLERYIEAIEHFNKILKIEPNDKSLLGNIGIILSKLERYEEAIEFFDKILEMNPNDLRALYEKSLALDELGKYNEAMKYYEKILDIDPTNKKTWVNKGSTLYNHFNQYKEALECFEQALELDPKFIIALNNKANALVKLERYDDALEYYNKTLEYDPNYSYALIGKANLLNKLGKPKKAKEYLQKILKNNPNHHLARYNLSCLESLLNNEDEALQLLKIVIEKNDKYKKMAKEDSDFDNIRESKRFKKLIQ